MKVVAFNGSPREKGNTFQLLSIVLEEIEKEGIETKLIQLGSKPISGCIACYKCIENKDQKCVIKNDAVNEYIQEMISADGILFGSPTYCTDATSNMRAFIERTSFVGIMNNYLFKRKVGAAVVAVRRGGAIQTFNSMNSFFLIEQMIVAGSTYWNDGIGMNPGDIQNDEEGIRTMRHLGQNMAWLIKKISD